MRLSPAGVSFFPAAEQKWAQDIKPCLKMSPTIFPLIILCVFRQLETAGISQIGAQGTGKKTETSTVALQSLPAGFPESSKSEFHLLRHKNPGNVQYLQSHSGGVKLSPQITGIPSLVNNSNLAFVKWQFSMCLV